MTTALRLALILCMTLTGIGLGAARGTLRIDGQIVLCTGESVVIDHGGAGGTGSRAHLCPDMALSLMAALSLPDAPVPPPPLPHRLRARAGQVPARPHEMPLPQARGPPELADLPPMNVS